MEKLNIKNFIYIKHYQFALIKRFKYLQRLSAKELLRHRFIKTAKKTAILTELIEKHARWKAEGGEENDSSDDDDRWMLHLEIRNCANLPTIDVATFPLLILE